MYFLCIGPTGTPHLTTHLVNYEPTKHLQPPQIGSPGCGALTPKKKKMRTYLALLLWAAVSLGVDAMVFFRGSGGVARKEMDRHKSKHGVPLRRAKRGWMWNQFFLQEEYTGSDNLYVGKVWWISAVTEASCCFKLLMCLILIGNHERCHLSVF